MHNKTYCKFAETGLFFSHRGPGFCCSSSKKYKNTDPLQWWNSEYRKQSVEGMKEGIKVSDCTRCYQEEENNEISLRMNYNRKIDLSQQKKALPKQIDLDLSNFCNLKCIMCNSDRSSQWAKDEGLYPTTSGVSSTSTEILDDICKISKDLEYLTIQGGEPSIMSEYDYYFNFLKENNIIKNVELTTITNLTNLNGKFYKFLENFKKTTLLVSIDAFDTVNNYIRYPSNFAQIEKNLIEMTKSKADIKLTISLQTLSMFNFKEFLNWLDEMSKIYKKKNKLLKIFAHKVYKPTELCVYGAPLKLKEKFIKDVETYFFESNELNHNDIFKKEIKNIKDRLLDKKDTDINLIRFISDLDQKRNIKVTDYIPNFYDYF